MSYVPFPTDDKTGGKHLASEDVGAGLKAGNRDSLVENPGVM